MALKSTAETSSDTKSTEDCEYQSLGRSSSFDASAMRAFESFVLSMGRFGSEEMMVTLPLNDSSRSACTAPMAPLPLYEDKKKHIVSVLPEIGETGSGVGEIDEPSNHDNLLLTLRRTPGVRLSPARFYGLLFALDIDRAVFLEYVEFGDCIESGSILDIARADLEASYKSQSALLPVDI